MKILSPEAWIPAVELARKQSHDPDSKIGVIIMNSEGTHCLSMAANKFPPGIAVTPERLQRPAKYDYMEHAERNAICAAAYAGTALEGSVLYMIGMGPPTFPCIECARMIIGAGIVAVVATGYKPLPEHWIERCERAGALLKERGVEFIEVPWPGEKQPESLAQGGRMEASCHVTKAHDGIHQSQPITVVDGFRIDSVNVVPK